MDKLNTEAWVGRETVARGCVSEQHAALIHATLGGLNDARDGDVLPPMSHWCAFPTLPDSTSLGRDGHARGSYILPPVRLPRRMWARGSLTFPRALHVGEPIERRTKVRSVVEKMGKAGPMALVTLDHALFGAHGLAIDERQDLVYLEIPDSYTPPIKQPVPARTHQSIDITEPLLFRYSALTFNSHRIHYELAYTQEVEKYPGLIVHGPLQATLLMRAALRHKKRTPLFFDFRGVHPMFVGSPCDIVMDEGDEGLQVWTAQDGHQCMSATAVWETPL